MKSKKHVVLCVLAVFAICLLFSQAGGKGMIPKEQFDHGMVGPFSGKVLVVINKAISVLESEGLKLENYNVSVFDHLDEKETSYGVLFRDPDMPRFMTGGGSRKIPTFEVDINKETLEVEASRYSR